MGNPKSISKEEFNLVKVSNLLNDNQDGWYDARMQQFNDDYDFSHEASARAKRFSAHGKSLLNLVFDEWVGYYEAQAEQVWGLDAKEAFGELNAGEMVDMFSDYFEGWVEGMNAYMNETNPEDNV